MSANISIDNNEIDDLLRECNDILSKCNPDDIEIATTSTSTTSNDLETLRGQIDTICENISLEISMIANNNEQSLEINDVILNDEHSLNVELIQSEVDGINNLVTSNNESQDDIIFVGSSTIQPSSAIPIIDLCSPVTSSFAARKRKAILPLPGEIEIIEIDEKNSPTTNLTKKVPKYLANEEKLSPKVQCAICLDSALKRIPTTTTCGHIFCNKCIVLALKSSGKCPLCKTKRPKLIKLYGLNS